MYGYFDGDVINWRKFDPCGVWMHNVRCRYGLGYEIKYSVTSAWPLIQQSNAIFHHSTLITVGLWKHIVLYPEICEGLKQRTRVFLEMSNDTEGIPLTQFMIEHFNMDIMDQLVNIPLSEISIRLKNFRINGNKPLPEL
ncbi:hypothetical protein C9374_010121 [Naegleria lovaniensis]|uniref:Uncharacterized protein n=1 Tax=Naegleria lovaniensis TaxID=51637 RepID=A0AA88GGD8_NAELO|nr:uncharacterized protein C9374_010121 [Naegleria lovaniensis]KAG2375117.1 hypothetical protein C9374_010121 [Naegleria lovaniensis]